HHAARRARGRGGLGRGDAAHERLRSHGADPRRPRAGPHPGDPGHGARLARSPGTRHRGGCQRLYREEPVRPGRPAAGHQEARRVTSRPLRVLIAEDSPTVRELLVHILGSDPGIEVVEAVEDGEKAVAAVARLQPDVVTMDVHMPGIGGFEATRRIMTTNPLPILIVSGTLADEAVNSFRAVEAGAVALVRRPPGPADPAHADAAAELVRMIKLMAEVKV